MTLVSQNLGFVKAIHSGVNPPTNTQMLWYDTSIFRHKYYDVQLTSWRILDAEPAGNDKEIQFNNTDEFDASSEFVWDFDTDRLSIGQGTSPDARVDVRAQSALSINSVLRLRNNLNTDDLLRVADDGILEVSNAIDHRDYPSILDLAYDLSLVGGSGRGVLMQQDAADPSKGALLLTDTRTSLGVDRAGIITQDTGDGAIILTRQDVGFTTDEYVISIGDANGTNQNAITLTNNVVNSTIAIRDTGIIISENSNANAIQLANNNFYITADAGGLRLPEASGIIIGANQTPDSLLEVRAQSGLSTHSVMLLRDSTDSFDLLEVVGDGTVTQYKYASEETGNQFAFIRPTIYGDSSTPETGNIDEDLANAKIGITQKMYHNDSVAPTFPVGWVEIGNSAYVENEINIIYAEFCGGSRVEYWIIQEN